MKCLGCGVEKDMAVKEVYPYPEDERFCEEPIQPIFELECEPWSEVDKKDASWRKVRVCHECFHKLEPDGWISSRCWRNLKPVTPFEDLPKLYAPDGALPVYKESE
jgi:hypothetical protein